MKLTHKFWNEMGYEYLGKTAQNLRDKIAHIDKSTKTTHEELQMRSATKLNKEIINQAALLTKKPRTKENLSPEKDLRRT